MATILDGKKLSEKILNNLKKEVRKSGKRLKLAAILVGENPTSQIFLRQKEKACKIIGVDFKLYQFPESVGNEELIKQVRLIAGNSQNHGIIIQLPLPKKINTQEVLNLIPPEKDVDVLSEKSKNGLIFAPVLAGILDLFQEYNLNFQGKKVVIVGKGRLVGQPIAGWLEKQRIDFVVVDSSAPDISQFTKEADILISGTGQPNLIKGDIVKEGVIIVDAAHDVDFKSCSPKASYITPVPGGVGPMTVAEVIKNLSILNEIQS